ncbi:MAG: ferredoxin (4Fe-4S iron-sulfur cluster binding protein) [Acidobacteria bacterium]|nr:ferredoxin (4Fe-4S iron-sulfur cluster binding protein) [Acidobacteriota bacterium]
MSVEVTFEQDGGDGLVAAGTSVWEAAKRLGVKLRADCRGRGECETCAVKIINGSEILSPPKECEYKILGGDRVAAGERLACQTTLVKPGSVIARAVSLKVSDSQKQPGAELPLKQQLGAFIETEAVKISEAVNYLRGKSNALVEKFLNLQPKSTDASSQSDSGNPPPGD